MEKVILLDLSKKNPDSESMLDDLNISDNRAKELQDLFDAALDKQKESADGRINVMDLVEAAADSAQNANEYTIMVFAIGKYVAEASNPLAGFMHMMSAPQQEAQA